MFPLWEEDMIFKGIGNFKYIFSTIKSSFMPALFLLVGLLMFYSGNPYSESIPVLLHYTFLFVTMLTIGILYVVNQSKPLFSLLLGFVSYLIINYLKREFGEDYISTSQYQCLCFALPLNFALLYFLPQSKLNSRRNMWLFIFLLLQITLLQHFCDFIKLVPHIDITIETVPLWACAVWAVLLAPLVIAVSFRNTAINTGLFYADSGLFMGLLYSSSQSGITTFFLGFALTLLCATILDLYKRYNFDILEHVGSKSSFLTNANTKTKFGFKYTVALFSIDNHDKLRQILGNNKLITLEQMVVNSILKMPYDLSLYRYNEDELIMVFQNENARQAKEFADNIRHNIAASEFILSNNATYKITISVCVTEKTRKDLKSYEVIERAHNALQKSYRFNCNITTVV